MKKTIFALASLIAAVASVMPAHASDNKQMLPIAAALADDTSKDRLGDSVKFFFGNQPVPPVLAKLGSNSTSRKTNAFGKSAERACNWAFLSAMLALEKRAHELGANAVINIVSNYGNVENSSATEFECHVGGIMAGVAFKGEFVKIADK
jgi:uncharacterized protein YbjQ (UPF0145 family)